MSKSHIRIENSAELGVRLRDLGSKHGAVITKIAPTSTPAPSPVQIKASLYKNTKNSTTIVGGKIEREKGSGRPAGLGGKNPPIGVNFAPAPTYPLPLPSLKNKFFPIPVPREPEWVAGAHGDCISLGKTVFVLEREGGPEPLGQSRCQPPAVGRGAVAVATAVATVGGTIPARSKAPPKIISKGFTANPNLVRFVFGLGGVEGSSIFRCKRRKNIELNKGNQVVFSGTIEGMASPFHC